MKHLSDDDMKNYVQNGSASWPKAGDRYRHYKGGEYEVVVSAVLENTLTPCVVYRSLKFGTTWYVYHVRVLPYLGADAG